MGQISNMTFGLRDNAKDLIDIWLNYPNRRREFGQAEIDDIKDAANKLSLLIKAIQAHEVA